MHRRRAGLPLSLDQASSIAQNGLTFLGCQAWMRETSTNHTALQTCHGQKSLLAIAVPGQGWSVPAHHANLVINVPLCRKIDEPTFTFYHFKRTPTTKLTGQYRMPTKGASVFSHFQVAQVPWPVILTKFSFSCPGILLFFSTHRVALPSWQQRETFVMWSYVPALQMVQSLDYGSYGPN